MTHRMTVALLSLVGFFISLYLWLWKVGIIGTIVCGDGGCETVQLSAYSSFLGIPVAFFGMLAYGALIGLSLLGLQPRWRDRQSPTVGLVLVAGAGVLFTGYLSYLEAAVIHAWCRWCVASAVVIVVVFLVALSGLWALRREEAAAPEPPR